MPTDSPDLMVVSFPFDAGAKGALHSSPHVPSTFCPAGRFRVSLAGEEVEVAEGDSFIIPSGARQGCVCIDPGERIDPFTPVRNDYL